MELVYVLMENEGWEWGVLSASASLKTILNKQQKQIDEARSNAEYMNESSEMKDCDFTWITVFKDGEEMSSFKYSYEGNNFVVADEFYTQGKRNEEVEAFVLPLLNSKST